MRAILIDPVAEKVAVVEYNGDYKEIYDLLSDAEHGLNVDTFMEAAFDGANNIYLDDNGLLNDPKYFFKWAGYPQPLAGRGLILGQGSGGDSTDTTLTVAEVRAAVSFPRGIRVKGFEPIPEGTTTNLPGLGEVPVFGHTVIFEGEEDQ